MMKSKLVIDKVIEGNQIYLFGFKSFEAFKNVECKLLNNSEIVTVNPRDNYNSNDDQTVVAMSLDLAKELNLEGVTAVEFKSTRPSKNMREIIIERYDVLNTNKLDSQEKIIVEGTLAVDGRWSYSKLNFELNQDTFIKDFNPDITMAYLDNVKEYMKCTFTVSKGDTVIKISNMLASALKLTSGDKVKVKFFKSDHNAITARIYLVGSAEDLDVPEELKIIGVTPKVKSPESEIPRVKSPESETPKDLYDVEHLPFIVIRSINSTNSLNGGYDVRVPLQQQQQQRDYRYVSGITNMPTHNGETSPFRGFNPDIPFMNDPSNMFSESVREMGQIYGKGISLETYENYFLRLHIYLTHNGFTNKDSLSPKLKAAIANTLNIYSRSSTALNDDNVKDFIAAEYVNFLALIQNVFAKGNYNISHVIDQVPNFVKRQIKQQTW